MMVIIPRGDSRFQSSDRQCFKPQTFMQRSDLGYFGEIAAETASGNVIRIPSDLQDVLNLGLILNPVRYVPEQIPHYPKAADEGGEEDATGLQPVESFL